MDYIYMFVFMRTTVRCRPMEVAVFLLLLSFSCECAVWGYSL